MSMRTIARAAAAVAAATTLTFTAAGTAGADPQNWNLTPRGTTLGTAYYNDDTGTFKVWDTSDNGWFVRLDVWRVGNFDGTHVQCYDFGEADGQPGETCREIWVEDTFLRGKLCQLYNGTEITCTGIKEFYA